MLRHVVRIEAKGRIAVYVQPRECGSIDLHHPPPLTLSEKEIGFNRCTYSIYVAKDSEKQRDRGAVSRVYRQLLRLAQVHRKLRPLVVLSFLLFYVSR